MHDNHRSHSTHFRSAAVYVLVGLACMMVASCGFRPRNPARSDTELGREWPKSPRQPAIFREASYGVLRDSVPVTEGAEYVNDDELCMNCHKVYADSMQQNVHRGIQKDGHACEACHGPASSHLKTRGKEPGMLWNFRTMRPAQAAEVCLKCHEENACSPGAQWRTSVHAHNNLTCVSCHTGHYNVPPGTKPTTEPGDVVQTLNGRAITPVSYQESSTPLPPLAAGSGNMGAAAPGTCYRCHGDKQDMQQIAGPHQICGPNNFNCTTCHDAHGKILESSRQQLCLNCHQSGSPVMAWHSSTHAIMGVACTDCHSPHASANVPQIVAISHFDVERPKRLPMSVNDPDACYKCHSEVFAKFSLPSHHPIKEGKTVLLRLPRCARSDGRQPASGNAQPAVLQVPRREAGSVRLRASAGDRELRDLPLAARHGGQQPAAAADHVPVPAMPRRAPLRRAHHTRQYRHHTSTPASLLHGLHDVPLPDPW